MRRGRNWVRIGLIASYVIGKFICGFCHMIWTTPTSQDMHEKGLSMESVSQQTFLSMQVSRIISMSKSTDISGGQESLHNYV
jgi:hypothetical protein